MRLNKLADGKTSKIRILTLNVGSMTGRGRDIAAVLTERKIGIAWAEKKKNIISVYAPQVGCSEDEKLAFWEELDDVLQSIPDKEGLVVIGYCNGHVGMERADLERWHG